MKVGVTTSVLDQRKWFEQLDQLPTKTIEIGARSARIFFDPHWIEKTWKKIQGYDLSFHSGTVKIFLENEQFTKAEIERLKAEIIVCKSWGIKELIFHLKHDKLESHEATILNEICVFAQEHDVQLLYESNGCLVAEIVFDVLNRFPSLKYNLDLGHLNVGIETNRLGCDLSSFLQKINKKTEYVHAHNNLGEDKHQALRDGSLDWKLVLSRLDNIKKVISESKTKEDNEKNVYDIKEYLAKR